MKDEGTIDVLHMEEQALVAGCVQGKSLYQRKMYEKYAPKMLGLCMRYAGDKEAARDLLHDGFIRLFEKIKTYKGEGSLEGWIKKVFITTALEHLRKNKHDVMNDYKEYSTTDPELSHSAIEQMSANELMDMIAMLPEGFRTIFNLYVIEGYSHQEIAKLLNIQEVTSRSQYMRARTSLQEMIKKKQGNGR